MCFLFLLCHFRVICKHIFKVSMPIMYILSIHKPYIFVFIDQKLSTHLQNFNIAYFLQIIAHFEQLFVNVLRLAAILKKLQVRRHFFIIVRNIRVWFVPSQWRVKSCDDRTADTHFVFYAGLNEFDAFALQMLLLLRWLSEKFVNVLLIENHTVCSVYFGCVTCERLIWWNSGSICLL